MITEKEVDCLKIGYTLRSPEIRIIEINEDNSVDYANLDPKKPVLPLYPNMRFSLLKSYKIKGCYEIEQLLHRELEQQGYWLWGELFTVSLEKADACIQGQLSADSIFSLLETK